MAWLEYVLPLIFLMPLGAIAVVVLTLRNLHDARLISPFDARRLREPGQALRDRLEGAFASLFLNATLGPIVVLTPLVYGMGRMLFAPRQDWVEWAIYGLLSTLLVLLYGFLLMRDYQYIKRLKLGLACDLAVGQTLERLVRPEAQPYALFHDIQDETFAVDHVAVTPRNVFAIITLARTHPADITGDPQRTMTVERERLRFPGWSERRPLKKARRASAGLRQWLSRECGIDVPVRGVLVLPGWTIVASQPDSEPLVVDGRDLDKTLAAASGTLDETTRGKIVQALSRRAAQHATATY